MCCRASSALLPARACHGSMSLAVNVPYASLFAFCTGCGLLASTTIPSAVAHRREYNPAHIAAPPYKIFVRTESPFLKDKLDIQLTLTIEEVEPGVSCRQVRVNLGWVVHSNGSADLLALGAVREHVAVWRTPEQWRSLRRATQPWLLLAAVVFRGAAQLVPLRCLPAGSGRPPACQDVWRGAHSGGHCQGQPR